MPLSSPRASEIDPPLVPEIDFEDTARALRQLQELLFSVREGLLPIVGSVTLRENQTTTALTDDRIHPGSWIGFTPTTANAAAVVPQITARSRGSATITHASDANTDKTYLYAVLGI